ncbi:Eukaryotic translation initiation factor 3 subunit K [Holothuria leucospilota]|uniref:Eukaryotic translation initiation factor 3 subunit K n=1 Tax=Holothuria leucospilota TaxID=206669 RepID=A0A9Q1CFZ3_HOLLE|nr:Eukaryotic translation initiation factor 3 subunit K [Holothuria leucospilota]
MDFEEMEERIAQMMTGINRYNPENLMTLEMYVNMQCRENKYDLEANLAVLKLYQLNPMHFKKPVTALILLKALTNLPHSDFTLCKCLIDESYQMEEPITTILHIAKLLEMCKFKEFWVEVDEKASLFLDLKDFNNSIRKYICHVVSITYQQIDQVLLSDLLGSLTEMELQQWIKAMNWKEMPDGYIFINNQEENVKTKNITEKIGFDNVSSVMKLCRS